MRPIAALICVGLGLGMPAAPAAAQTMATAEELAPMVDVFRKGWKLTDKPMRMGIPVHGGILEFEMPHNFVPALRAAGEGQFLMAFIPDGEIWPEFTHAVLVQSSARLGAVPDTTAAIAEGVFKPQSCAGPALWEPLGEKPVGSPMPAFLVSTGCPALGDTPDQGQQTLLALLRGEQDAVALSFARRGPAFEPGAPPLSAEAARAELARFGDILLCRSAEQTGCRDIWARELTRRNAGK
ncbi:MAG TPA: hypothetical protein VFZ91_03575 [Allosphingosinicella sp.]